MKLAALALVTTLGLGGVAFAEPARPRAQLQQLLLERFDRNHDGRLEPQERRKAIRTLRRLARRMTMQDRREARGEARGEVRGERKRALLRRFDTNGDGVIGPDRNGDGWLDDRDQR
jgi:Ca2+-binding EF-hand superfamily protein